MDIRQLEYVVETAKRGSYTKAADALFVSRQGLSKAVKNLEKEIGQSLFQGLNGHLKTTSMGEAFIQEASPIVSSFKNLNERFTRQNSKQAPKMLSVAAAHGVMLSLPRNTVTRFQSNNPDILLSLEEVTTEAALDMADEGEVDIALVGSTPHYLQDFDIELIVKTGIYLYVPTRSPLSQKTSLTLQNLDGQPFITTGKRNHLHRYFIEKCTSVGVRPRILFTTSDIALLIEQAERRQACYFGFPPTIKEEQSETHILKPVDIGREPWFGTYAVRKKDAVLSDAAHIFWLYLANEIAGSRNKQ